MRGVAKRDLPSKTCMHCGRPFTWRRRWARDWEQVRYCSDACRRRKVPARGAPPGVAAQAQLDFSDESGEDGGP